jgi:hypothetical protein
LTRLPFGGRVFLFFRSSAYVRSKCSFPKSFHILDYFVQRKTSENTARIVKFVATLAANPFSTNLKQLAVCVGRHSFSPFSFWLTLQRMASQVPF